MGRLIIPGFRKIETSSGGEGGTTNYEDLTNKPSINNVPLVRNLKTVDLKLTTQTLTEEGVPADAKTVGDKLKELVTSLTALSEQLGNHTVKSDVPENAVFTDTVYDDTEVKESIDELNSNLGDLAYGEKSANSNIIWNNPIIDCPYGVISKTDTGLSVTGVYYGVIELNSGKNKDYTIGYKKSGSGVNTVKVVNYTRDSDVCVFSNTTGGTFNTGDNDVVYLYFYGGDGSSNTSIYSNLFLCEGTSGTYEPYIPSVKMLAEEVNAQNESLSDYGLNNVYEGEWSQNGDWIRTENYISANENDVVVVKCDAITSSGGFSVLCFDSSSETSIQTLSSWTAKEAKFILPSGTTRIKVSVGDSNLTVEKAGNIGVYINNQIEQIKNDLSKNEFYSGTREIELMGYNIYGFGFWIPIPTLKNITVNSAKVFSGSWIDLTFEEVVYNKGIFPIAKFTNVESITKGYVFGCKINVTIS